MTDPLLLTLLIGVAGGIGSVLRVWIMNWKGPLPFGLIATNTLAAMFLGYVYSGYVTQDWLIIAVAGFAGGLSTFSGIAKAGFDYWHTGRLVQIFLTLAINIVLPLVAMMLVMRFV